MKIVRIENWSVTSFCDDPYTPPECIEKKLQGKVYGHPHKKDGKSIITSDIISAKGRIVSCKSRKYRLGKIDPNYRKWLKEYCPDWNWRNPIPTVKC